MSFTSLIDNAALMLSLVLLYGLTAMRWRRRTRRVAVIEGIIFGAVGVAVMMNPCRVAEGIILDTRSVVVSVASLFGGWIPAAISVAATAGYRIWLGGTGAVAGTLGIVVSAGIGLLVRAIRGRGDHEMSAGGYFLFGLIVHVTILLCGLALPWSIALDVLEKSVLQILTLCPVVTMVLGVALRETASLWRARIEASESQRRYQALFNCMSSGVAVYDAVNDGADFVIRDLNPAAERITKMDRANALGRSVRMVFPDVERFGLMAVFRRVWRTGQPEHHGASFYDDGRLAFWAENFVYRLPSGEIVAVFDDVTARKESEQEIANLAARLRLALRSSRIGVWDWDLRTRKVYYSPEWKAQLGYTEDEISDRYEEWESRLHPDDRERVLGALREYLAGRSSEYALQFRLRHKDGSYRWIYTCADSDRDEKDMPRRIFGCHVDITEHVNALERVRESEKRYRTLLANLPQRICLKDRRCIYVSCNENYARDLGIRAEEIAGKSDLDFYPRDLAEKFIADDRRVMESGRAEELEERHVRDGKESWTRSTRVPVRDESGNVCGVLGVFSDITEQKSLEERLRQAQRLEAVGKLAGGIAHDFNNILTGIQGYVEILLRDSRPDSQTHSDLREILALSARAADLTRQLLAFSRRQPLRPVPVNMNALVGGFIKMLKRIIGEDIELVFRPAENLGSVRADPGQIEQILLNLSVNARDAMPNGGRLTIETAEVTLDEDYVKTHADAAPGNYVALVVSDTGCGMDRATLDRIFEPFFTTKDFGKGTGLGLATVYGIVKQHGGNIYVYSEVGKGTTFRVYLPRADESAEPPSPATTAGMLPRGSETILLVEDDEAVRSIAERALAGQGYRLLVAASPAEAEAALRSHAGEVALLVTDIVMPGCNGKALYERLAAIQTPLPVLFMSGYSEIAAAGNGFIASGVPFLPKPFSPSELVRKVRQVIEARSEGR